MYTIFHSAFLNNEYTNVFGLDNGIEILKFDFSIFVTGCGKTGL